MRVGPNMWVPPSCEGLLCWYCKFNIFRGKNKRDMTMQHWLGTNLYTMQHLIKLHTWDNTWSGKCTKMEARVHSKATSCERWGAKGHDSFQIKDQQTRGQEDSSKSSSKYSMGPNNWSTDFFFLLAICRYDFLAIPAAPTQLLRPWPAINPQYGKNQESKRVNEVVREIDAHLAARKHV
jgi:hypothetical protein